ncbi:DUF2752 domain-containing protein [Actinomadura sp. NTSP31]|uniref:DUF2752 domain-containing protein n=1 Tax=Actinomadura sp. NTSP31 TaxID=1735447 RepID=UPI0035BF7281
MGGAPGAAATGAPDGALGRLVSRTLTAARRGPRAAMLRVAAMAVAAVGVSRIHRLHDPGVLRPWRALTGPPRPLLGGTAAFTDLVTGRPARGVRADPAALTGAIAVALAPPGPWGRWWALQPKTRARMLGTALAGSELWQLVRFGVLRV